MKNKYRLISVIIPAYQKEKTIIREIETVVSSAEKIRLDYEIIVVADGMSDDTYKQAKKMASAKIRVVGYEHNHGKGYALRYGISRASGDVIAFIDSGSDLNPTGLEMLMAHFNWYDADIVVGSKWHPVSIVDYPLWRKILSKGYGILVRYLFGLRVSDTQLGMKIFRRRVLESVLPRLLVKKYAIDIELLAVADRLGFKRIYEAPVELRWEMFSSSIASNLISSIWNMFWDTLAVFYRLKIRKYYDDRNRRRWRFDPDLQMRVNVG